ncbi:MAG: bifunctional (p)ppGpp synthetase/guanosine-3',5'-bis(diphosphate) 3'-pyrophosphohydrolase [Alphaproteobacteria bacterium]|nr:MAG: bifunctional (p)ppGpp synthetase/guanosine-3',5'-bis(diphosphate) 3'-pyrophosphohydrolase [Alphaproteobacteria bacterium]
MNGPVLILRAAELAASAHAGQLRKGRGQVPYINHPLAVARIVSGFSRDAEVLAASILHDVLEDTDVSESELADSFGARVTALVKELTDDPAWADLPLPERKARQAEKLGGTSAEARMVKIADQLANIRDLTAEPEIWPRGRHEDYLAGARAIVAACRPAAPELARKFDDSAARYAAVIAAMA